MKLYERIQNARRLYDICSIIDMKGKKKVVCPLPQHQHSSNTPSFSVFYKQDGSQWFRCFGNCQCEGDVIDLVGYTRLPGYNSKSVADRKAALEILDERFAVSPPPRELPKPIVELDYSRYLPCGQGVIDYAATRGLALDTLRHFKIGQDHRWMTIPAYEHGKLMGVKLRNITKEGPRFIMVKGSRIALFNHDAVFANKGVVVIAKGEIPTMLLHQYGILACAPTGGEGALREEMRTALALSRNIVIGDNDEPGRVMAPVRAAILDAKLYYPPDPFKDVDAWVLADQNAIPTIRGWINELE